MSRSTKGEQKADCDRCGFTYDKAALIRQNGLRVCKRCYDKPKGSKGKN